MRVGGIGNDPIIDDSSPTTSSSDESSSSVRDRISRRRDDDPETSGIGSTEEERERSSSSSSSEPDEPPEPRVEQTQIALEGISGGPIAASERRSDRIDEIQRGLEGISGGPIAASERRSEQIEQARLSLEDMSGGEIAATERQRVATEADPPDIIERAAAGFTERVAEPFGDVVADATPLTAIEEAATGRQRSRDFFQSAGAGVAQLGNVPGHIDSVRTGLEAQSETQQAVGVGPFIAPVGIPDPDGQAEQADRATESASAAASSAAEDPFSAAGTGAGVVAGGLGVAGVASRASRASASSTGRSTFDLDDFVMDTRAQRGGRRRSQDTDFEQEAITIERMADEQQLTRSGPQQLEDIPGVSVQRPQSQVQQRTQQRQQSRGVDDLEQDIIDGLEDLGIDPQTGQTQATQATQTTQAAGTTAPRGAFGQASGMFDAGGAALTATAAPTEFDGTTAAEAEVVADSATAIQPVIGDVTEATEDAITATATETETQLDFGAGTMADTTTATEATTTAQTTTVGATTTIGTQATVDATTTAQETELDQLTQLTGVESQIQRGFGFTLDPGGPPRRIPRLVPDMENAVQGDLEDLDIGFETEDVEFGTQSLDEVDRALSGDFADFGL